MSAVVGVKPNIRLIVLEKWAIPELSPCELAVRFTDTKGRVLEPNSLCP